MVLRVLVAASLIVGLGSVALLHEAPGETVPVRSRAAHMAEADTAAAKAVMARGQVVLHLAAESCDVALAPAPAPTQARVPATPGRHDI